MVEGVLGQLVRRRYIFVSKLARLEIAVQPTEDERNQIEQLADDVELLMNYVIGSAIVY